MSAQKKPTKKGRRQPTEKNVAAFAHKKSLGQNFLRGEVVPKWLTEAAAVTKEDTVLEIGPGEGALTKVLLQTGAKVIALETDKRLIEILENTFAGEIKSKQLTLVEGDARHLNPTNLGLENEKYKVVANIPYYLSGFLLRTCLENECQPNTLVFLMQKEVVERVARDRKESLLSLSVKAFGEPKYVKTVTKGHFVPPPKVNSAILLVKDISMKHFQNRQALEHFFNILHLGFAQKRKQLFGNLSQVYDREILAAMFSTLGISTTIRAEDISLPVWLMLCQVLPPVALNKKRGTLPE